MQLRFGTIIRRLNISHSGILQTLPGFADMDWNTVHSDIQHLHICLRKWAVQVTISSLGLLADNG